MPNDGSATAREEDEAPRDIKSPDYSLSEALHALADIAPTLKEAELRVLLELARRAQRNPHKSTKASSRELATACGLARSKTVAALDSLCARCLITTRQGTATSPSAHQVNFLLTTKMGGPLTGPPQAGRWSPKETTP